MNLPSQSHTIDTRTLCTQTISSMYSWAYLSTEHIIFPRMKLVDLVNLPMITHMTVKPFLVLGNSEIKSMVMYSHFCRGD